jgi:UDP-galactopyranose mutase
VLGFEFTGAPSRYYPVELPDNRRLNDQYRDHITRALGDRVRFVGRLANYVYIDMDDCMRAALDCATELLESVYRTAA